MASLSSMPLSGKKKSKVAPFLVKTFEMVSDPAAAEFVQWRADGLSFEIVGGDDAAERVLPVRFKHSKIASFHRQLNLYGFRKLKSRDPDADPTIMIFSHPSFQRGKPELLGEIKRNKKPTVSDAEVRSLQLEGEVTTLKRKRSDMEEELEKLTRSHEQLQSQLETAESDVLAMRNELSQTTATTKMMRETVSALLSFLSSENGGTGAPPPVAPETLAALAKQLEAPPAVPMPAAPAPAVPMPAAPAPAVSMPAAPAPALPPLTQLPPQGAPAAQFAPPRAPVARRTSASASGSGRSSPSGRGRGRPTVVIPDREPSESQPRAPTSLSSAPLSATANVYELLSPASLRSLLGTPGGAAIRDLLISPIASLPAAKRLKNLQSGAYTRTSLADLLSPRLRPAGEPTVQPAPSPGPLLPMPSAVTPGTATPLPAILDFLGSEDFLRHVTQHVSHD